VTDTVSCRDVAAGGALFNVGEQSGGGEPSGGVDDLVGGADLDTEVIDRAAGPAVFDQDQLRVGSSMAKVRSPDGAWRLLR